MDPALFVSLLSCRSRADGRTLQKAMRAAPLALVLAMALPAPARAQDGPGHRNAAGRADEDPPELGEAATLEAHDDDGAGGRGGPRVACLDDTDEEGHARKGVQARDFIKQVTALSGH